MGFSKWMKGAAFCIVAGGTLSIVSAADTQDWKIESDANGVITKMTYANPKTPLGIEKDLIFNISQIGKPQSGQVDFVESKYYGVVVRDMKPGELIAYFDMFDGSNSIWNYYQTNDKLIVVKADGKIPADWLGRQTRVITKNGKNIIGKLIASTTPGEWAVDVDGACCGPIRFTMAGVSQVQELKAR